MIKTITLGKISNISTGFSFKGELYSNSGIRVVRGENVTVGGLRWDNTKCWNIDSEHLEKYILKKDDIVIGMDGSRVGKNRAKISKKDLPLFLAQRVACVRNNHLSNQLFLYYLIRDVRFEEYVKRIQTGSSIPHISQKQIENFTVSFPSLNIQEKIGNILSSLDSKIEINNQINIELESISKTLYDYWFVQFDFPDKNGKPYKSSGGKMVYNEVLKSEKPKDWNVEKLEYWIDKNKSGDWGKENEEGNYTQKVHCIRGADINGLNGIGSLKSPVRYIIEKNLFKTLEPHDLIVEISGGSPTQSTGRLAFVTNETLNRFDAPLICSNFCKAVTLKNSKHFFNFIYEWNRAYDNGILFGYEGKTSGLKNLLFDSFISSYDTVVPEDSIAEKFYDFMKPIQAKKQKNLLENQQLAELRDWLLPMLMNGQVTVSDESAFGKDEVLAMVAEPSAVYEKAVKVVAEKVATKKPKKETKPVIKLNNVDVYKRTLLAVEIVYQYRNEYTLGHLKLQKMLYLCKESENMNLPMHFLKQAMGPYDNQLARSLDKQFEEKKWFKYQNGDGLKYVPLENCGKHSEDFKKYFEEQLPTINKLIETFRKFTSPKIEAVATLYACWKEAIANNELVNDAIIINKFYNWSKEKEKFNKPDLVVHLAWMREKGIYPKNLQAI